MRDFRDAKVMAHSLRDALKAKAVVITHSESLELIARAFGYDNWNILSAKIGVARPDSGPAAGPQAAEPNRIFYCSFCGKSQHEATKLVAGPAVFICDECVDICVDITDAQLLRLAEGDEAAARAMSTDSCCITSNMQKRASSAIVARCSISTECLKSGARRLPWMMIR